MLVLAYVSTVVGVPVYMHYCGGELEKINYLVKTGSCCDGEEEDASENNGCCKNEGAYVQNTTDFTFKTISYFYYQNLSHLFTFQFQLKFHISQAFHHLLAIKHPPNLKLTDSLISTSVLRI